MSNSLKRTHPSADRNVHPIAEALRKELDLTTPHLRLLEISSGTGQHVGTLAPLFPNITFQPTEFERSDFPSISAYAADCPTRNILPPLFVDISQNSNDWHEARFREDSFDYMFNCNMLHITPWACAEGLFTAAGRLLKPGGILFTYGPYMVNGVLTPESNVSFNRSLRGRNPQWGVRDIAELKKLATYNYMELKSIQEMPSNNKFLSWVKQT